MDQNDAGNRCHIAIVEDEPDLVFLYQQILVRMDMPVSFVAFSGTEALHMFRESVPKPLVVLMDNRLPGRSGIDLTREMLKAEPRIRIIFISADHGVRDKALRAGACTFIEKPASVHEIMTAIRKAMGPMPSADVAQDHRAPGVIGSL